MSGLIKAKCLFSREELDKLSYVRRQRSSNVSGERLPREWKYGANWTKMVGYALLERKQTGTPGIYFYEWEVYLIKNTDYPYSTEFYNKILEVRPSGWNVGINGEGCTPTEAITIREMKYRIVSAIVGKTINGCKRFPIVVDDNDKHRPDGLKLPNSCMDCKRPSCSERYTEEPMEYGCTEHLTQEELEECLITEELYKNKK